MRALAPIARLRSFAVPLCLFAALSCGGGGSTVHVTAPPASTGNGSGSAPGQPGPGSPPGGGAPPAQPAPGGLTTDAVGIAPVPRLRGRRIVVAPGHGYHYDESYGQWLSMRGVVYGTLEDLHTNEIAIDHLLPQLERLGIDAWSCRARSRQEHEVVIDDDAPSSAGGYADTGGWQTTGAGEGWRGGSYRVASADPNGQEVAVFQAAVPEAGRYPVFVRFRAGADRAPDALHQVVHAGGVSWVWVDQTRDDRRWRYLGTWWFDPGTPAEVRVWNRSGTSGALVVVDVARFGSGMGSIARGGSTSGRPRWQEAARYWLEYTGVPASVYAMSASRTDRSDDYLCRGEYADWQGGELYLSIHSNASGTGARGVETFMHDSHPPAGSDAWRRLLHETYVRDVHALWDPTLPDRGLKTANFGELRTSSDMPTALIELVFHDSQTDTDLLNHARFRRDAARAMTKAVVKMLDPSAPLPPLPPVSLRVQGTGAGEVTASWEPQADPLEPSASAQGYRVFLSRTGRAFDDGTYTERTSLRIAGLAPGEIIHVRVAAVNVTGESLPTETLSARAPAAPAASPCLIVNGYDRLDRQVTVRGGQNTGDYAVEHARALAAGITSAFDCASNEAVEAGLVDLRSYALVVWILGRESEADETFSFAEQALVGSYLDAGGALIASGAEIGWDLDARGSAADRAFLSQRFGATLASDDSGSDDVVPAAAGPFVGMPSFSFGEAYAVPYPDALQPAAGAQVVLRYASGDAAAVATGRAILLGFPIETVRGEGARADLLGRAARGLVPGI